MKHCGLLEKYLVLFQNILSSLQKNTQTLDTSTSDKKQNFLGPQVNKFDLLSIHAKSCKEKNLVS